MILPALGLENAFFWTAGADGELRFQRCQDCGQYLHPPMPICRSCRSRSIAVEAVSGRGVVEAFTVNHQQWFPDIPPPYVVAIVSIEEDPAVRLTTNVVGCEPDEVRIGMPVEVSFRHVEDVWLPVFGPRAGA
jgi:uncharacterized OB-fold protein